MTPIAKVAAGAAENQIQNSNVRTENTQSAQQSETGRTAGQTASSAVASGASAADELMSQLLDDRNETNARPVTDTVLQALKEAGLSQNQRNISIVNSLLGSGMPISRESIRTTLSQAKTFPDTDINTLIQMDKAGITVNSDSIRTVSDFLNNVQVLLSDLNELTDMVEALLSDAGTPAETADAIRLAVYNTLNSENAGTAVSAETVQTSVQEAATVGADAAALAAGNITPEALSASATAAAGASSIAPAPEATTLPYRIVVEATPTTLPDEPSTESGGETVGSYVSGNAGGNELSAEASGGNSGADSENTASQKPQLTNDHSIILQDQGTVPPEDEAVTEQLPGAGRNPEELSGHNDYTFRNFDELAAAAQGTAAEDTSRVASEAAQAEAGAQLKDASAPSSVQNLPDDFKKLSSSQLKHLLKQSLSISPKELSQDRIKELYRRANDFINRLKEAADNIEHNSTIHVKANRAADDLKLLNSLNQMFPHIELPLKLENANAEGELYVYTNRRGTAHEEGHSTALLHLNMPNLGVVDIHLDLADRRLGLNFYSDDDARVLLAGDITHLRERLEAMDYAVTAGFNPSKQVANDMKAQLSGSTSDESGDRPERLSFDIRA